MTFSNRNTAQLSKQAYDVLIIGGGISGAWLSLHCAQLGLKTALIDKGDYASQTSSSSSKLLHGGIRYLQQMQFGKVRESAMERAEYIYAAAHLSNAVPFAVPTYRDFQRSKFFLNCGMLAYRLLCIGENRVIGSKENYLPPIRSISAPQLNTICDLSNEAHTGGVVFYERHMLDSERMVLAIIQTAQDHHADTFNYVSAQHFLQSDDRITGVAAKDELTGETFSIQSKLVINAAGPWIDNLNQDLPRSASAPRINGFAVGSHIVTRQLSDHAIALTTKHQSDAKIDRGGRHVFIIPWRGFSLIGTSYDEIENPNGDLSIQADHVSQLLDAVNAGLPSAKLTRADLISGYSGLYPLQTDNIKRTVYQGSGEYQIIDHQVANGVEGLVTALGAKYTTGRKLSELTMKLVGSKLGMTKTPPRTKLRASQYQSLAEFSTAKVGQYSSSYSAATIQHLIMQYGSDLDAFFTYIADHPEWQRPISDDHLDLVGQIFWAVEKEQAVSLHDVLFHRTSLGLLGISTESIHAAAGHMSTILEWSDTQQELEINRVLKRLNSIEQALRPGNNDG
ncbi:glycerol-3-phosphate dehydrogenase/oxidase [Arenicella xantha]|uniref:Glycerol-3-phosphate dehydrogenase n=1 Tax=Arenicella xantha TaxID=644221 RepID=A0A395JHY4_9GAMM|nr:glycerol-3-phosphate dehydrogenase/oxidase [Arenicella xantha]RBP49625.1 glycerol-3-phosphate dehydrogenase [Arenicella xantha]